MPNNDFILPAIVVLGIGLIVFIFFRFYNKSRKDGGKGKTKVRPLEELSKDKLIFEIKGKAKFLFEKNTKVSSFVIHVLTINKCRDTVIIRNIEIIMGDFIGKLEKEKAKKTISDANKTKGFNIGEKLTFPFSLTPNTPNNITLTFMFDTISVVVRKFDVKLYTSHGDIIFPITVEIDR